MKEKLFDYPEFECGYDNLEQRKKIAAEAIGETLELLNKQIQWFHDHYAVFPSVKYYGGDNSRLGKWIEINLLTAIKWPNPENFKNRIQY